MSTVGKPIIRQDASNYATGKTSYLDDLGVKALYVGFVRSPYPHAIIKSIQIDDALKTPGIVGVFTGRDINKVMKEPIKIWPTYPPLPWKIAEWTFAENEVKYVGEPVAVVVGQDRYVVRDAVDKVNVEYEPQDYVVDYRDAMQDKVLVHRQLSTNRALAMPFKAGNPDEMLKKAERQAEVSLSHDRMSPSPMEPRGIISSYNDGGLTVYMTTQSAHLMKYEFSRIFGIPSSRVRVITPPMGGGFGAKITLTVEDVATVASSILLKNAVKWIATRSEELLVQSRKFDFKGMIGFNKDGTLLAVKGMMNFDLGAYVTYAQPFAPLLAMLVFPNGYRTRDMEVFINAVYTHTPPVHIYRGAGKPEGVMVMEKIMNVVADELGIDEAEVRLKNLITSKDMPYTNPFGGVYDTGDYRGHLMDALRKLEYYTWKKWAEERRKEGRKVGVGLSFYAELTTLERWEYVETRLTETGDVLVLIGSSPHGQGTETGIAQLVAEQLQIDVNRIRVEWGDTDVVKAGVGTFSSRTLTVTGSAAIIASKSLVEKMKNVASKLLKVDPIEVDYSNGVFKSKNDPNKKITWTDLAKSAVLQFGDISTNAQVEAIPTSPYGVHMMIVEVDDFGKVKVLRSMGYDDIGRVVNPKLAEAQIQGGFIQAAGETYHEKVVLSENGQTAVTFAEYNVPTMVESPREIVSLFAEKPYLSNYPSGTKGVGEAGIVGAIMSYVRAVENATGKRFNKIPITPEDIIQ